VDIKVSYSQIPRRAFTGIRTHDPLVESPTSLPFGHDAPPTYLKTISAKVVMFGIKLNHMKCTFELTYFYDLLTYLKMIIAKVVMFGIKPKLVECRFEVTFYDLLTYLRTVRITPTSRKDKIIPGFYI
jgi:hypothetical protein